MKGKLKFSLTIVIIAMLLLAMVPVMSNASSPVVPELSGGMVAKIGEDTYATLYDAVVAANASEAESVVIELLGDSTESQTITITRGLTISGNDFTVTSSAADSLFVQTNEKVSINAVDLVASKIGIKINDTAHNVSVKDSSITAGERGITVLSDANENATLVVDGCVIQKSGITNYDKEYAAGEYRGISLWQYVNSEVSISNTTIQGFAYAINAAGSGYEYAGTTIDVDNCVLKGRAGLNIWGKQLNIDVKNSTILGLNNEAGPTEVFAGIVVNNSNNVVNIISTEVTNYQNSTGLANENARQYMVLFQHYVDSIVNISGTSSFTDTTKRLDTPIFDTYMLPSEEDENIEEELTFGTVNIISGTYNVPIAGEYVSNGYVAVEEAGEYTVGPKATAISARTSLDMTIGDESSLGVMVTPSNTVEKVTYESSDEKVATVNSVGMVTAVAEGKATITITAGEITEEVPVNVTVKDVEFVVPEGDATEGEDFNVGVSQDYEEVAGVLGDSLEATLEADEELAKDVEEALQVGALVTTEIAVEALEKEAVAEADKDKMLAVVSEDGIIHQYLDISVLVKADGQKLGNITELTEPIKLSIEIPEDLIKEDRTFFIVSLHEGVATKISGELDGTKLVFEVSEFSTYALAYEDAKMEVVPGEGENAGAPGDQESQPENKDEVNKEDGKEDSKEESKEDKDTPKTGDAMIIVYLGLASVSLVALVIVIRKQIKK